MYVFEQEEDVARISIALLPHKEAEETSLPLHAVLLSIASLEGQ